ncbi:MAG: hypothetical protein LBH44_09975 [Treponema sp.]|jgi:NAD(P)H-flavin reductase|nr:hypothetical protein [Treponema sp.]
MSGVKSIVCPLINNTPVNDEVFSLYFHWDGPAPKAGQFFMVKPLRSSVFLARPLSVAGFMDNSVVKFLIAKRGKGTQELAAMHTGEEAELTGPLGNAWEDFLPAGGKIALVSGGVGIAPLAALAAEKPDYNFHFYAGFRQGFSGKEEEAAMLGGAVNAKKLIIAVENFSTKTSRRGAEAQSEENVVSDSSIVSRSCPKKINSTTNQHKPTRTKNDYKVKVREVRGKKIKLQTYWTSPTRLCERHTGRIPDFLDLSEKYDAVYACGPEPMLKALKEKCEKAALPCFVSLERRMACGVGACLGCTVSTLNGNHRCCAGNSVAKGKDGTIFDTKELIFDD